MTKKILLAIFLFVVSAAVTSAQMNPEKAISEARDQFSNIKNRSIELERMKREANKRPADEDYTIKFPEIKEDFEKIQKTNSSVIKLTAVITQINYSAVFKFVSDLNHRAARLKSNLFASELSEQKKTADDRQIIEQKDIKTLVNALDKSVNSFVHSSIFQNINLVNSDDSLKAQKDLETVIKVSSAIKEKVKELAKNNSQK